MAEKQASHSRLSSRDVCDHVLSVPVKVRRTVIAIAAAVGPWIVDKKIVEHRRRGIKAHMTSAREVPSLRTSHLILHLIHGFTAVTTKCRAFGDTSDYVARPCLHPYH